MGQLRGGQEVPVIPAAVAVPPVQNVMLDHEEDVENHREQTQAKLGGVAEDGAPVVVVVREDEHLRDGQSAASEVQKDVANAPA